MRGSSQAADSSPCIIVAWGKSADTNKRIASRAKAVLGLLKPYQEKIHIISDGERDGLHPLTPSLRMQWALEPFDWAAYEAAETAKEAAKHDTDQ